MGNKKLGRSDVKKDSMYCVWCDRHTGGDYLCGGCVKEVQKILDSNCINRVLRVMVDYAK